MKKYSIILAVDEKNGIWKNNTIPWRLKKEQQYFKEITTTTKDSQKKNVVIMWRKTWESIPDSVRPLPGRINCVLSSKYTESPTIIQDDVYGFDSFDECHKFVSENKSVEEIFIIGGSYLYNLVLDSEYLKSIYLTRIQGDFNCDVFFSDIPSNFKIEKTSEKVTEWDISYQMFEYKNKGGITKKIIKPSIFIWGAIFLLCIIFLVLQMFDSKTPETDNQEIPEVPNPIVSEPIAEEVTVSEPSQEGENITTQEPLVDSSQDVWESDGSTQEKNKGTFESVEDVKNGVTIYYPVTDISELDTEIKKYIWEKRIEYRILSFNKKNSGGDGEIVLDYEVLSESEDSITILFTDTMDDVVISTREISY